MIDDLKGKAVLITGSSTGIGAAAAVAFGANGAKVAVHYNKSKAEADKVAADVEKAGGKAILLQGDVTSSAACKQLVEKTVQSFGRIDVLITNVGGLIQRIPVEQITDELFDQVLHLNVRSALACITAAVPHMRKQGGGNIINVTSVAARHGGGPGAVALCGLEGLHQHGDARSREGTGQGQHPRQRRCAGRDLHAVPRSLQHAADARELQGDDSDEPHRHARRVRRRVPVSRVESDERLRHRVRSSR